MITGAEQIELTARTAGYLACRLNDGYEPILDAVRAAERSAAFARGAYSVLADTQPGGWIAQEALDAAIADAAQSGTWERDLLALAERRAHESGVARGSDYARVIDALDTIRAEVEA